MRDAHQRAHGRREGHEALEIGGIGHRRDEVRRNGFVVTVTGPSPKSTLIVWSPSPDPDELAAAALHARGAQIAEDNFGGAARYATDCL